MEIADADRIDAREMAALARARLGGDQMALEAMRSYPGLLAALVDEERRLVGIAFGIPNTLDELEEGRVFDVPGGEE